MVPGISRVEIKLYREIRLYRSCGNCSSSYARHVIVDNVALVGGSTGVGINEVCFGNILHLTCRQVSLTLDYVTELR